MSGHLATATIVVQAPRGDVWDALTDPAAIKRYMFGADVTSDFTPGSPITWRGEYEGKAYEDKGEIVAVDEPARLELTHFSPLSGQPDIPENYHTLVYQLRDADTATEVTLTQDGNASAEEADHARQNWEAMLASLKKVVEGAA